MQKLAAIEPRVETGAVRFGDDWPGLFIRGDNAMALALAIETVLHHIREAQPESYALQLSAGHLMQISELIRDDVIVPR